MESQSALNHTKSVVIVNLTVAGRWVVHSRFYASLLSRTSQYGELVRGMHMGIRVLLMSVSTFFMSQHAVGATLWDESTAGDLSSSWNDPVLNFSVGTNEIRGSDAMGEAESDSDQFGFVISEGNVLTSVSYAFSNYVETGIYTSGVHKDFHLYSEFTPVTGLEEVFVETDLSPVSLFSSDLPLTAGSYKWVYFGGCINGHASEVNQANWDYNIIFTVNEVPIPAAAWLFGSALLGLGAIKRRKAA